MLKNDAQQCSSMMHDGCAMYFQNAAKGIHNKRLQCFGKNLFHFFADLFELPALKIKVKTHLDVKRLLSSVVEKKTWFPRKKWDLFRVWKTYLYYLSLLL